ncbi:hypothetical protein [Neorhodopirellula pilleata]|nr:hypothetical protein [Neorhodopirellula pilleata]
MPTFFMSGVSAGDHWMFLSSCGALTAGRRNPDSALFPYYPSDKLLDLAHCTGPKTLIRIGSGSLTDQSDYQCKQIWEPHSHPRHFASGISQNLYKNMIGNRFLFEERNHSLGLVFRYGWSFGRRFGFIRSCELLNASEEEVAIELSDGFENLMPSGLSTQFQLQYSNLADAYKCSELMPDSNVGVHYLSSIPTDRAEPSEGLRATLVWHEGLASATVTVSDDHFNSFRHGATPPPQIQSRGKRHAYVLSDCFNLSPGESRRWSLIADVDRDHSDLFELERLILDNDDLATKVEADVNDTEAELIKIISHADGRQCGSDLRRIDRHQSNVLFNVMRGGLPADGYQIPQVNFREQLRNANRAVAERNSEYLETMPDHLELDAFLDQIERRGDVDLSRIASEYLPFRFSRRHGDPTRPWNRFSIDLTEDSGEPRLSYQGNWRDIFQNWEALSVSFPQYAVNMVLRFVNATGADGYNPYRITQAGFEWEVPEPDNPWSNIGYWGDHQIAYLLRLLQQAHASTPERLDALLDRKQCVYANIPYRIRSHREICDDPFETIDFDERLDAHIAERVSEIGADGRLLGTADGDLVRVSLLEKLLVPALVKISNFVPGGGIWLNTQRPEWNDANNALVGRGLSVVTTCYLRRYLTFLIDWLSERPARSNEPILVSELVGQFTSNIANSISEFLAGDSLRIDDRQRRSMLNAFANAGSEYRQSLYRNGFSGEMTAVTVTSLVQLFANARQLIDQTIHANRRDDGLYHSYNLLQLGDDTASVSHLHEMLEGQVAVLNSGLLSMEQSAGLLDALRSSRLYRADQQSYLLYPDRQLARFADKNCLPNDMVAQSDLIARMIQLGNTSIVRQDVNGQVHFQGDFRNANDLSDALDRLALESEYRELVESERQQLTDIWETTFGHRFFTGRSGTFFGYEGLGSIYWHMVSKLALAVIEQCLPSSEPLDESGARSLERLLKHYREIRAGLGIHKTPRQYGGFPQDPYSHTPEKRGVQQPGMTGQVKEDILARWHELGLRVRHGCIHFDPAFFESYELLQSDGVMEYFDLSSLRVQALIPAGGFAFTFCQTPIRYLAGKAARMRIHQTNGETEERDGLKLTREESQSLMGRKGKISLIEVELDLSGPPSASEL